MEDDERYEENYQKAYNNLRPKLTDEFLDTLVLAAKTIGWIVDYVEVEEFLYEVFSCVDKECPDIKPFDYSSEDPFHER